MDILMLTYDFTGSRRELPGLGDKVAKPQKYDLTDWIIYKEDMTITPDNVYLLDKKKK